MSDQNHPLLLNCRLHCRHLQKLKLILAVHVVATAVVAASTPNAPMFVPAFSHQSSSLAGLTSTYQHPQIIQKANHRKTPFLFSTTIKHIDDHILIEDDNDTDGNNAKYSPTSALTSTKDTLNFLSLFTRNDDMVYKHPHVKTNMAMANDDVYIPHVVPSTEMQSSKSSYQSTHSPLSFKDYFKKYYRRSHEHNIQGIHDDENEKGDHENNNLYCHYDTHQHDHDHEVAPSVHVFDHAYDDTTTRSTIYTNGDDDDHHHDQPMQKIMNCSKKNDRDDGCHHVVVYHPSSTSPLFTHQGERKIEENIDSEDDSDEHEIISSMKQISMNHLIHNHDDNIMKMITMVLGQLSSNEDAMNKEARQKQESYVHIHQEQQKHQLHQYFEHKLRRRKKSMAKLLTKLHYDKRFNYHRNENSIASEANDNNGEVMYVPSFLLQSNDTIATCSALTTEHSLSRKDNDRSTPSFLMQDVSSSLNQKKHINVRNQNHDKTNKRKQKFGARAIKNFVRNMFINTEASIANFRSGDVQSSYQIRKDVKGTASITQHSMKDNSAVIDVLSTLQRNSQMRIFVDNSGNKSDLMNYYDDDVEDVQRVSGKDKFNVLALGTADTLLGQNRETSFIIDKVKENAAELNVLMLLKTDAIDANIDVELFLKKIALEDVKCNSTRNNLLHDIFIKKITNNDVELFLAKINDESQENRKIQLKVQLNEANLCSAHEKIASDQLLAEEDEASNVLYIFNKDKSERVTEKLYQEKHKANVQSASDDRTGNKGETEETAKHEISRKMEIKKIAAVKDVCYWHLGEKATSKSVAEEEIVHGEEQRKIAAIEGRRIVAPVEQRITAEQDYLAVEEAFDQVKEESPTEEQRIDALHKLDSICDQELLANDKEIAAEEDVCQAEKELIFEESLITCKEAFPLNEERLIEKQMNLVRDEIMNQAYEERQKIRTEEEALFFPEKQRIEKMSKIQSDEERLAEEKKIAAAKEAALQVDEERLAKEKQIIAQEEAAHLSEAEGQVEEKRIALSREIARKVARKQLLEKKLADVKRRIIKEQEAVYGVQKRISAVEEATRKAEEERLLIQYKILLEQKLADIADEEYHTEEERILCEKASACKDRILAVQEATRQAEVERVALEKKIAADLEAVNKIDQNEAEMESTIKQVEDNKIGLLSIEARLKEKELLLKKERRLIRLSGSLTIGQRLVKQQLLDEKQRQIEDAHYRNAVHSGNSMKIFAESQIHKLNSPHSLVPGSQKAQKQQQIAANILKTFTANQIKQSRQCK